jgi:hypothetical protein
MSRIKEELFILPRCNKCKNDCKQQSAVKSADIMFCKLDNKKK